MPALARSSLPPAPHPPVLPSLPRKRRPPAVTVAGLSLVVGAMPAAAQAADVDSAVSTVVDIVKATGEVVKQGVSAAQTGAEYAKAAYDQVRGGGGGSRPVARAPRAGRVAHMSAAVLTRTSRRVLLQPTAAPTHARSAYQPIFLSSAALCCVPSAGGARGEDRCGGGGACGAGGRQGGGGCGGAGRAGMRRALMQTHAHPVPCDSRAGGSVATLALRGAAAAAVLLLLLGRRRRAGSPH